MSIPLLPPDNGTIPFWLSVANIFSTAIIFLAVLISAILLLLSCLQAKRNGYICLRHANPQLSGRDAFNAILLSHISDDAGNDGEPIDLEAFWKQASLYLTSVALI